MCVDVLYEHKTLTYSHEWKKDKMQKVFVVVAIMDTDDRFSFQYVFNLLWQCVASRKLTNLWLPKYLNCLFSPFESERERESEAQPNTRIHKINGFADRSCGEYPVVSNYTKSANILFQNLNWFLWMKFLLLFVLNILCVLLIYY